MTDIAIRSSNHHDAPSLRALAQLDSAPDFPLDGDLLVAEMDGRIVAAREVAGGRVIADPFERTAFLVDLLSVRARQLAQPRRRRLPSVRGLALRSVGRVGRAG